MQRCFYYSSRENRRVPVLGALWRTGVRCVEKGLWPPKFASHNMGLCDANRLGRGRGSNSLREWDGWLVGLAMPRKFRKNGEKGL